MNEKLNMYCTKCNHQLELRKVDGMTHRVCLDCSQIELGYTPDEKELVTDLQECFKNSEWRVVGILLIIRKYCELKQ